MIVGVTNEKDEPVLEKMQSSGMEFSVAITPGETADDAYGVRAVPRSFLVDVDGKLVWSGHPASLREDQIVALLKDV